jgi:hypothetical protein
LFVIAALTAYIAREFIRETVIVPLAYAWWAFTLIYRSLPQLLIWGLLVFFVFTSAFRNILLATSLKRKNKEEQFKPHLGEVERTSILLSKRDKGNYYKWQVANRLGNIARELIQQRKGLRQQKGILRITSGGLNLPDEIETYLETGLNGSFADYPQPAWWNFKNKSTLLDTDPNNAIHSLESEMYQNQ